MSTLILLMRIEVNLGPAHDVGPVPNGYRRIIPIVGGRFHGATLSGEVMPGGADWNLVRADGVMELSALYTLKTSDGFFITIHNVGMISAPGDTIEQMTEGTQVDGNALYARMRTQLEAPTHSPYDALNRAVYVGVLQPPESMDKVSMEVFQVA